MNTTHMSELNGGKGADVDVSVMPLVKFLNKLGVETVSSSAGGDTPKVDCPAHITMRSENYTELVNVLFRQIHPMIVHLPDVHIEVMFSRGSWLGMLSFPSDALEEVTKRVGCWVEMLHK